MRKLRVVQIGVNHDHASAIFKTMTEMPDVFEVVGYCIPEDEPPRNKELEGVYEGYPRLTLAQIAADKSIDCATIETFERNLTKYAIFALEQGLPIHMDKPGGVDRDEFKKMIDMVKEKNIPFHTGYMYRYNPAIRKMYELVENGELGEILHVEAQMNCWHKERKRHWMGNFPGGMLFFLGCHMIDFIYRLQGEPSEVIPLSMPATVTDGEDFGMAVYKYPKGVSFAKATDDECGGFQRRQLVVVGSKGTVEICPLESGGDSGLMFSDFTFTNDSAWAARGETVRLDGFHRYRTMMAFFAAMVRGEETNPYTPDYELALHDFVMRSCGDVIDNTRSST